MAKYGHRWVVGAIFALVSVSGATAAFAAPPDDGTSPDDAAVATGEPPVPLGVAPTTTVVIVATDDPPLPPVVATGPPPTSPIVTNVSPRNPGNVILPETGARSQALLAMIATLLLGTGVGLQQLAARRRLIPARLPAGRNR
jgi:hypothetical protein